MASYLWAFLGISLLVIVTPGPDTALTIRNTLMGGRRAGIFTALGVATGQVIWALATTAGIVTLLVASEPVFAAIKLAGATYLILIGVQTLWAAFTEQPAAGVAIDGGGRALAALPAFRQGVISDLGNPKMAVFFTSLLPQFAPAGGASFAGLAGLGLIFCSLTFLWLAAYAAVVARAGAVLRRARIRRAIEGVTGTLLIALGLRIAAEPR